MMGIIRMSLMGDGGIIPHRRLLSLRQLLVRIEQQRQHRRVTIGILIMHPY